MLKINEFHFHKSFRIFPETKSLVEIFGGRNHVVAPLSQLALLTIGLFVSV